MIRDWRTEAQAMLEVAGCHDVETRDNHQAPGLDIHEMGGARMGSDPKTSILNKWNQVHASPNVFVTDGACMTSTGNQSPSILYMALTARAVNHAVSEMAKQNL
jgi:choline dehydrogenase-like flavoprotein